MNWIIAFAERSFESALEVASLAALRRRTEALETKASDIEFMNWCGSKGIPFSIIFTKTDKLSSSALQKKLSFYKKEMLKSWEELPPVFISSSQSNLGRESILNYLNEILNSFSQSRS